MPEDSYILRAHVCFRGLDPVSNNSPQATANDEGVSGGKSLKQCSDKKDTQLVP